VSAVGNVAGNYFIGNGSQLTGISSSIQSSIANGISNVNIATANGNVTITSNAAHTWNFDAAGNLTLPGNVFAVNYANGNPVVIVSNAYGNANVADFLANGFGSNNISTTGNIALGNIVPAVGNVVSISAEGNSWLFSGATSNLTIPANGAIRTSANTNGNIILHPDGAGTVVIQGNTTGALLRVVGDEINSLNRIEVDTYGNVNGLGGAFTGTFSRGTPTVPAAVQDQDRLAGFTGKGYDGSVLSSAAAQITVDAVGNWSPSNHGTHISFYTTPVNSTTEQEVMRLQDSGNLNIYNGNLILNSGGNITGANVVSANAVSTTGNITAANFFGNGNTLSNVAAQVAGSWTLATGTNTANITVPINGTYSMWVRGNIPNGIVVWNATVTVTNTNVPVIGQQFAWNYEAGNALILTSIPAQIIGTAGAISNASPSVGTTTNVFEFTIDNNSGNSAVVNYGYTKIG
jgi:hypothetical protein